MAPLLRNVFAAWQARISQKSWLVALWRIGERVPVRAILQRTIPLQGRSLRLTAMTVIAF
jgi:hypothetical protein